MGLSQALSTAVSGLRVTQAGMQLIASNVANAETPGYVRKTMDQVATATGGTGLGVRTSAINRVLDLYVQRQLRTETSGGAYADLRADFYERLQQIYGDPGSETTLETIFNKFSTALQGLATSPDSSTARRDVLSAAQVLAQQLNNTTSDIQGLRTDAEQGLADAVKQANNAMQQIARINQQLGTANPGEGTTAALLDERDNYVQQLSQLMDIRTVENDHQQIAVSTNSGIQLVGTEASQLTFDAQGTITPNSAWSSDPDLRNVGTIKLISPTGGDIDLIANKAIRSGQIAALIEMRDQVLVEAQGQMDALAAALSQALSDRTVDGTAVTSGAQAGFDIDIGALSAGNSIEVSYTDNATNTQRTVTLVRVDDPSALPLANTATSKPNDRVVGIDFTGGMSSVVAQIANALGAAGIQASNPSGTTLRLLDDGASNKVNLDAVSLTETETSLTGGGAELPFFTDAQSAYTGAITGVGFERVGFAGRITVNTSLVADPSRLVVFQTSPPTAAGDGTRPNFLYDRINSAIVQFAPQSGIGTVEAPYSGSLPSFVRQIMSQQGEAAANAQNLQQGQAVVVQSLQQRFNDSASVNIDQEMAHLLTLQNAYAANARVLTAVREMLDALLQV
jgi:flagellar hook-associated protein 1 FlgK